MWTIQLCWLILVACSFTKVNGKVYYAASNPNNHEWWSNTIMYQVYPRSFKDSNKDGVGDLKGIIEKLDHFVDIGVETLWIGPIFKSPQIDMGYDIQDYKTIDPLFGTMDDFRELITEMNKRNLKFITDLVPNHSSDDCIWFEKSVKKEGKYKDYYIWKDAKNQAEVLKDPTITPIPPNNWLSVFGGSGWTWHPVRKQFYYRQFTPKQPDYNIRNPDVQKEILDIMEYWMDQGVAGFRFDAIKHLFESDLFLDETYLPGKSGSIVYSDMIHNYTVDQPESIDFIYKWREFLDDYRLKNNLTMSKIMSSESYSDIETLMLYYTNSTKLGAQIPFNFGLLKADKNNMVQSIDDNIKNWLENIPENMTANWVIENHDNERIPYNFGSQMVPVLTALKLILPGVDITYYGSEIGMENAYIKPDQRQDHTFVAVNVAQATRDGERTPMQWDDSINSGFTDALKPWLPVHPNYYMLNVATQKKIPTSNLNFFKNMTQLRKTHTLKYGDLTTYNVSKSIYILKRSLPKHETYIAVMNFGSETEMVNLFNIVSDIKEKFYVCVRSENSAYAYGQIVPTKSVIDRPIFLRPQSVIVLTDNPITTPNAESSDPSPSSSGSSSSYIGSKLVGLFCFLLFMRFL